MKRIVLAILTAGAVAGFAPAATAAPADPRVALTPARAPAGSTVEVSGRDFAPGEALRVLFDDSPLSGASGRVVVGRDGRFRASVRIPKGTPAGRHRVTATGPQCTAHATLEVTAASAGARGVRAGRVGAVGARVQVAAGGGHIAALKLFAEIIIIIVIIAAGAALLAGCKEEPPKCRRPCNCTGSTCKAKHAHCPGITSDACGGCTKDVKDLRCGQDAGHGGLCTCPHGHAF